MAETVQLPGVGSVKRTHLIAGVSVAGGVVAYAWWRAGTAAAGAAVIDPDMDQLGLSGDTGGGGGYDNPAPSPPVDVPGAAAPKTNSEWADRVLEKLAGTFDAAKVQVTIGKYLDRQGLVTDEQTIIRTAWGAVGRPPEGNYPIIAATTPTTPPPTSTPKPVHRMQWVSVRSTIPQTLAAKQQGAATEAYRLGVWKPSAASLQSVIAQAAIRNRMSTKTVVKPGQYIQLFKAVKQG